MTMNSKRGFTLVEMVAIIVVIVILAAIAIARYGNMAGATKNAVIKNFVSDCGKVRARMYYGDVSTGNAPETGTKTINDYVQCGALGTAKVSLSGNILTVTGIPADLNLFKDGRTTLMIDFGSNRYSDGSGAWDDEAGFYSKVGW